ERLLEAWKGEILARTQYEILAQCMRDTRRAQIIRDIAAAEGRHRERIENRLRELGVPIPDPSTVTLSWWQSMQARFAPVPAVMARMESAEQSEITNRYKRSTGDAATDAVLASIRTEEQGHSKSLAGMEAAHSKDAPQASGAEARLN